MIMISKYEKSNLLVMLITLWATVTKGFHIISPINLPSPNQKNVSLKMNSITEITNFKSRPMKVYIEDTDCYGLMYNGNYIRSYERALRRVAYEIKDFSNQRIYIGLLQYNWHIICSTAHKFKASPTLGGEYIIYGEKINRNDQAKDNESLREIWSMKMVHFTGDHTTKNQQEKVYNTAEVTIATLSSPSLFQQDLHSILKPLNYPVTQQDICVTEFAFIPDLDEFNLYARDYRNNFLSLRSVLNFFERSRSLSLGGPDILKRMQEDDRILWVVAAINDLVLINLCEQSDNIDQWNIDCADSNSAGLDSDGNNNRSVLELYPGQDVFVRSECITKRRGMIVECQQTLLMKGKSGDRKRIAQGVVTLCAVDRDSGRPTCNIPSFVRELFDNQ